MIILPDPQKTVKKIEDFMKMRWKKQIAYLLTAIVFIALGVVGDRAYTFNFNQGNTATLGSQTSVKVQTNVGTVLSETTNITANEKQNEKNSHIGYEPSLWTAKYYAPLDEDGFLCPSFWSGFPSPIVWNNEPVSASLSKILITYEVKNKDLGNTSLPTLIFALGKDPSILRFYLPQKTKQEKPQYVGFQKVKPGVNEELSWDPPQALSSPIELSKSEVVLRIIAQQKKENIVTYNFNVKYLSALTSTQQEDSFSYDVVLPTPNIDDYKTAWGLGIFKNSCFKIKTFQVM